MVVHKNIGRNPKVVRSYQDGTKVNSDVSGGEGIVSIWCLEKAIYGRFQNQGDIRCMIEVTDIEDRGNYQRSQVEGETGLPLTILTPGGLSSGSYQGRAY